LSWIDFGPERERERRGCVERSWLLAEPVAEESVWPLLSSLTAELISEQTERAELEPSRARTCGWDANTSSKKQTNRPTWDERLQLREQEASNTGCPPF